MNTNSSLTNMQVSNISSDNVSPLPISSMLHSLSINSSGSPHLHSALSTPVGPYLLKVGNLPGNFSKREAHALFALADGSISVELDHEGSDQEEPSDTTVLARFDSLSLVSHCAAVLNSKSKILGPTFPQKISVEIVDEANNQSIPIPLLTNEQSFQFLNLNGTQTVGTPVSNGVQNNTLPQRSRFSFNDTFGNETTRQKSILSTTSNPAADMSVRPSLSSADVGKSFLLMNNDEINDSIWGSSAMPSMMNGFSNTPQSSTSNLDWMVPNERNQNSSIYMPHNPVGPPSQSMDSVQPLQSNSMNGSSNQLVMPHLPSLNMMQQVPPSNLQISQTQNGVLPTSADTSLTPQKNSNFLQNFNDQSVAFGQEFTKPNGVPQSTSNSKPSTPLSSKLAKTPTARSKSMGNTKLTPTSLTPTNSSSSNVAGSTGISQTDLSLLARVPPPANPADQNPPCNTLYVGNLPPDATEQELRQLFANQQGFRRLSFRNKNSNGNGHGPMCFVEFDDVNYATIALAELYGSHLPRNSVSNKGGIRLSFSKNPLGVRGPNSRRTGSNSSTSSSLASASLTNLNTASNTNPNQSTYNYTAVYTKN